MKHKLSRCVLHVGAHRTGTTLLQEFMFNTRDQAKQLCLHLIEIDMTRKQGWFDGVIYNLSHEPAVVRSHSERLQKDIKSLLDDNGQVFCSDENILGTMEENWQLKTLYPDVKKNLLRLGPALELFDTLCVSVRSPADWWWSCASFLAQNGYCINNVEEALQLSTTSERGWFDVVEELSYTLPTARLVVREFNYFTSNPKRLLRDFTGWNSVKEFQNIPKKISNSSSRGKEILAARGSSTGVSLGVFFSEKQLFDLDAKYQRDIERIKLLVKGRGRFLG